MNWILEHLQILIGAAAAIAYVLNRKRAAAQEADEQAQRPRADVADDQAERTRRVQDEIRRKIAERRGTGVDSGERQTSRERVPPPLMRPPQVPPVDPFGGPVRRVVRKLEEAAANFEERYKDPEEAERVSEMARQAKLAERMRELQLAQAAEEKRAAAILLAQKRRVPVVRELVTDADLIRSRLRDPHELRRAVILREILGPPVGSR